ncbi:hypothetical protein N7509_011370 [Penicillium cosmopolitanum]|uniref:Uncharacterized protein n=1 Tax=Penicillium cosmopolitanum TaxID=1131564 RepID=A0A9W9VTC9_9EURO|nr:uncharacterized protein N7509_011370 [Penicillium cosmopolitanum]KAJ5388829.1 hypothetical protein N7509_011370 [Penicillium cosmopolitanum]
MAALTRNSITGRKPMKSTSIALMSIVGVVAMFRLMAKRGTTMTASEEVETSRGGSAQTDVGNKTARPPRTYPVPRGGSI